MKASLATPIHKRRTLSLTPLIDVVFLLLVFFMLASTFLQTRALTLVTPATETSAPQEDPKVLEVWLTGDGTIRFGGETVSKSGLTAALAEALADAPDSSVVVLAEEGARMQAMVDAVEAAKGGGAEAISTIRTNRRAGE